MKSNHYLAKWGAAALIALTSISATAQTQDKTAGFTEVGTVIPLAKGAKPDFNFNLGFTTRLNERARVGLGAGVITNFKAAPIVPIFARLNFDDFSTPSCPFVQVDLGYEMNTSNFSNGAVYFNPTIGYRYHEFAFALGYMGAQGTAKGAGWSNALSIRLSYYFGMHKTKNAARIGRFFGNSQFQAEACTLFPMGGATYETEGDGWFNPASYSKENCGTALAANFAWLFRISDDWYVGPVAGYMFTRCHDKTYAKENDELINKGKTDRMMIPLGLRTLYKMHFATFGRGFYPWASLDLGYSLSSEDSVNGIVNISPAIGISKKLGERHSVDLGLYYNSMKWEPRRGDSVTTGFFGIKLGITL